MQVTYGLTAPFQHGRGFQRLITEPDPAAGDPFVYTVPGDVWARLILCAFTLTTSDTTGDRLVSVTYSTKDGTTYGADGTQAAVAASTAPAQFYGSSERAQSEWSTADQIFFPLWGGFLPSGTVVGINVAGIDTTDQLAGVALLFEQFETGDAGYPIGGMDSDTFHEWVERFAD